MADTPFGTLLRQLRKERGYTLEELADKTGLTHVAIGDWERGKRNPLRPNILAVAEALGVPPVNLLRAAGMIPLPGDERTTTTTADGEIVYEEADDRNFLVETYDGLSDIGRETLKKMAEQLREADRKYSIGGRKSGGGKEEEETGEETTPS